MGVETMGAGELADSTGGVIDAGELVGLTGAVGAIEAGELVGLTGTELFFAKNGRVKLSLITERMIPTEIRNVVTIAGLKAIKVFSQLSVFPRLRCR